VAIWRIGDIIVTRVAEGVGLSSVSPSQFLTGFDPDIFRSHHEWMVPIHYQPQEDRLVLSIHSWLIRTPRHTILLDTCSGNHKNRPWNHRFHQLNTPYLERLSEAGVTPADIDIVLCTHLHSDHCGWNTELRDGRWVPTFPKAKYLFSRQEDDRWKSDKGRTELYNDSVLPVIESGQAIILDGAHTIDDLLVVEPSPGHTIGHVMLKAGARDDQAVFCGDVIHHPVQVYEPGWNTKFCEHPEQARATRLEVLNYCAEHDALLFPIHFAAPYVAGIVKRKGRFLPAFAPATG
jgi:glyoxylase-like metal-dependent hydrolase (beta-lactamase superfamily II)